MGLYQNHKRVIMRLVRVLKSHGYNALLVRTVAALKVICEIAALRCVQLLCIRSVVHPNDCAVP